MGARGNPPVTDLPLRFLHFPLDEFLAQAADDSEKLSTYVYRGCLTMFNGEPGGTKSWLMLHEALEIARKEKRVLYVALEGNKRKLQHRLERLTVEDNQAVLHEYLHVSFMPGLADDEGGVAFKLTDEKWVQAVIHELGRPGWQADVLFIDPLADAVDGDADREVEMRPAKDALKLLRFKLNLGLGINHHTVKLAWTDAEGGREVKPSKAHGRGSGAWVGTAEITVDVTPTGAQTNTYGEGLVTCVKARDFPEVPPEMVLTVTDGATIDGRTVVRTVLLEPKQVKGTDSKVARYRTKAIAALEAAPDGCLKQAELLAHLGLDGKSGGEILRSLSGRTGPLDCSKGERAKALGFSPNAHVYHLKRVVSESSIPRPSETPRQGSTTGGVDVSEPSIGSETHTPGASNATETDTPPSSETRQLEWTPQTEEAGPSGVSSE